MPNIHVNRFPKPYQRDEVLSRSWNIPGSLGFIHQIGGLEKQGDEGRVSYDAANHQEMVDTRRQKIAGITREYTDLVIEGDENSPLLLVGWGSTYGSLKAALMVCAAEGIPVALLHLRHLNPLPEGLDNLFKQYQQVLVAELNSGQLCQILRAEYLVDAQSLSQCNGQPFSSSTLVKAIKGLVHVTAAEVNHE